MISLDTEALLFDSDGVLIDSHRVVEEAWRQIAGEFGLDADRLIREQPGVRAEDILSRYLRPHKTLEAVARLEDLEVGLAVEVVPLPGSLDLVGRLPAARWAIVTSASRRLAEVRWRRVGLDAPATTITADDVSMGKPDPAPYLRAAELLGVDPARCVVFEDSPSGGAAALAIGATVVAVGDQPWQSEPDLRVHDLRQVSYEGEGLHQPLLMTINPNREPS